MSSLIACASATTPFPAKPPQLEWYPLFGLVDHDTAMVWCMEKLDSADIVYHPENSLAGPNAGRLPITPGVHQERSYCDEQIWDGDQMVNRTQVFASAEALAQWVSDQENGYGINQ